MNKKFLENIRVLVKPKVISCFQKKIENRRKNELTLKLVLAHKTKRLNRVRMVCDWLDWMRVFGHGLEMDERCCT